MWNIRRIWERMKTGEFNKTFQKFWEYFIPIVENVKWEVEKETENGKLVRVSSPNARVHIQTSKKGNKFEISGKLKGYIKMNYNPNPAERNLKGKK